MIEKKVTRVRDADISPLRAARQCSIYEITKIARAMGCDRQAAIECAQLPILAIGTCFGSLPARICLFRHYPTVKVKETEAPFRVLPTRQGSKKKQKSRKKNRQK